MGRINYYEFPKNMSAHDMYVNGALSLKSHCILGRETCKNCSRFFPADWNDNYCQWKHCDEADPVLGGVSVSAAKRLLLKFGGAAYTYHCERDGTVFEVSDITLKGNNSRFSYSRHL